MLKIIYPCFNNYDLMFGENADFLLANRDRVLLVDDHSSEAEFAKGESWCREHGIKLIRNKGKGIPAAVDFVMRNYCDQNDWLLVMQQDVAFIDSEAITRLSSRLERINKHGFKIGAIGFPNFMSASHYHPDVEDLLSVEWNQCWLGIFALSSSAYYSTGKTIDYIFRLLSRLPFINLYFRKFWHKVLFHRNFAPLTYPRFSQVSKNYKGVCAVELPVWTSVAINAKAWSEAVTLDPRFVFHLWFPDVSNQLMNNDWYVCNDTDFIVHNNWQVKFKYDQLGSVEEGKRKDGKMERYGPQYSVWRDKWGYDYEDPYKKRNNVHSMIKRGSVLYEMLRHNPLAPMKIFDLDEL